MDAWRQFHCNYLIGRARYTRDASINTLRLSEPGWQPGLTAVPWPTGSSESCPWGREGSRTPQASGAEIAGVALGPPSSAPPQPWFSNRSTVGPAEAKVVIYHIELGPQGEKASPCHSSARNQKSRWNSGWQGRILRWTPRFPPLVYTTCVIPSS